MFYNTGLRQDVVDMQSVHLIHETAPPRNFPDCSIFSTASAAADGPFSRQVGRFSAHDSQLSQLVLCQPFDAICCPDTWQAGFLFHLSGSLPLGPIPVRHRDLNSSHVLKVPLP